MGFLDWKWGWKWAEGGLGQKSLQELWPIPGLVHPWLIPDPVLPWPIPGLVPVLKVH